MVIPQLQFLNEVIDVPVVQVVQLPRWWSQLQFTDRVYMPVVAGLVPVARQCRKLWFAAVAVLRSSLISLSWSRGRFPWSSCSEDHGDSAVAVFFWWSMSLLCRSCSMPVLGVFDHGFLDKVICPLCKDRFYGPVSAENCRVTQVACIFLRPLISGSHLFVLLPEEYNMLLSGR